MGFISRENPQSILNIGVGYGRWGFLCREQLEWNESRQDPKDWKTKIYGIESNIKYHNPVWDFAYDQVFIGDALVLLPTIGEIDLVLMTDFTRFDKPKALEVIEQIIRQAKGAILCFPDQLTAESADQDSSWAEEDIKAFSHEAADGVYFLRQPRPNQWVYARREGVWQERDAAGFMQDRALLSTVPGSLLSIPVQGPGSVTLRMMAFRWGGAAQILLNGKFVRELDLYSSESNMVDTIIPLSDGAGTLTIQLLSKHNPESLGNELWFDQAIFQS